MPNIKTKIKVETKYKNIHSEYPQVIADIGHAVYIHVDATQNCQLFTIGGMNQLLNYFKDDKEVLEEMDKIANTACKERCLIDINQHYSERIDKLLANQIIFKQPYTSSNGSEMVIYMLNMDEWYIDDANHDWEDDGDYGDDDDD